MIRTFAIFAAAIALTLPAHAATIEIESDGPVIELSIFESVTAEPDLATIGAGVSTTAPTAVEAMRRNSTEMARVIAQIKAQGVDEKDIQTTGINLNARYDYNRTTQRNEFRGYQVSNRVSVKLRDIDQTGQVLDALVSAGATDLNGPSFSIENDEAAKDQARGRALDRAQKRAQAYAAMLGYEEVRVLEINESIRSIGPVAEIAERGAAAYDVSAAPPVQPGLVSTGVALTIKFEMVDDDEETDES